MNKILCVMAVLLLSVCRPCLAREINAEDLLSIVRLEPASATQDKISALLGKPMKTEENKKKTYWYYFHGASNLVISWNKRSAMPDKFAFTCEQTQKRAVMAGLSKKLISGATDMVQAIKLLGTPRDMTIRMAKQEMHYAYENKLLRLFFRNGVLVDYCLY